MSLNASRSDASYYFVIVGPKDNPLYELEQDTRTTAENGEKENEQRHLKQFIVHAALDIVEDVMWTTNQYNLKVVDRFNDWLISAYLLPSNVKFMLMHDSKNDDGMKSFFTECHELFIKVLLNPFHDLNEPIKSIQFDTKVKALAKKYIE